MSEMLKESAAWRDASAFYYAIFEICACTLVLLLNIITKIATTAAAVPPEREGDSKQLKTTNWGSHYEVLAVLSQQLQSQSQQKNLIKKKKNGYLSIKKSKCAYP